MAFSSKIKEQILVDSARHCCVCHNSKGIKVEVHHIIPQSKGGKDNYDNAIALCFDCHADAGHYNDEHPRGLKFSPTELRKQKERWFEIVRNNKIEIAAETQVELIVTNNKTTFEPEFIKKWIIRTMLTPDDRYKIRSFFGSASVFFMTVRQILTP
jgi:hypothetical protein